MTGPFAKQKTYLQRLKDMPLKNLNLFVKEENPVPGFEYENLTHWNAYALCRKILEERLKLLPRNPK